MSGHLSPAVVLSKYNAHKTMESLAALEHPVAEELWRRIHRAWVVRGMANQITLAVDKRELRILRRVGATTRPIEVNYKYLAIYQHPKASEEVRLKSVDKPPKKRSFRVPGLGTRKFVRVKLYKFVPKESSKQMAKKSKKKAEEEIEELEGLEELEELEEPEDEDDEEETPKKKRRTKKSTKKSKPEPEEDEDEDEDEEDEEDEDDEEEEEAPKKRKRSKKESAKASKAKTSKKDKAKKNKKSKGGSGGAGKTTKELTGGVGTAELAEAASDIAEVEIEGRDVRIYLRKNEIPKDEENGRYHWPSVKNKEFQKLAKAIAKEYGED